MNMDNIEWKTRVDLAAAFRLADLYGWSDMLATHLSARIPARRSLSHKPYGCVV